MQIKKADCYQLILGVCISLYTTCKTVPITSNQWLKPEIESYDISKADTLVDIGCRKGDHDTITSHFYPNLYFILEDIRSDHPLTIANYYKNTPL